MKIVFTQYNTYLLNKLVLLINLIGFNFVNRSRLPSCSFGIILAIFLCDSVTRWFVDDTTTFGHSSVRIWSWLIWQWLQSCNFLSWLWLFGVGTGVHPLSMVIYASGSFYIYFQRVFPWCTFSVGCLYLFALLIETPC